MINFISQEEIESLRLKMPAQTLLVVVGSSDDSLRVKRLNRSMEGVSQLMIDNMIMVSVQSGTDLISVLKFKYVTDFIFFRTKYKSSPRIVY